GTRSGSSKGDTRIVSVPDVRLEALTAMYKPRKETPATVEFVDPLVAGQQGARFVESLVALMRDADALTHVVRAFENPAVPHARGSVDAVRDFHELNNELLLADLGVVEKRLERLEKDLKKMRNVELEGEYALLQRCQEALEAEHPLRSLTLTEAERKRLRGFGLLTSKAQLVVLNLDEAQIDPAEPEVTQFRERVQDPGLEVMALYGKIESEIAQLPTEEAESFLQELGLSQSGLDRFIRTSYALLGLCSFFTAGEKEVRAWTIPQRTYAPQAAGVIHSDLERGFIRAEVIHYDDLMASGSLAKGREVGKLRIEGKEYQVQDGDVLLIRFNV
ncbi:MAG: redox-regulated ATPase YchF, partial [Candidatus Tectomicrobia bacterium]|nr:redox-regulated ATPase YchF [Candidatus Tectomicrobia bacterium]